MRPFAAYLGTSAVAVTAAVALVWPWLDGGGRAGVLVGAAVALLVQAVAFGLLLRYRASGHAFVAVLAGGTALRFAAVAMVAIAVIRWPIVPVAPTLLALAGFLFGLLLLEPLFLRRAAGRSGRAAPESAGEPAAR
ncbi:MAG: hypothetical protein HY704_14045 [Gemmatimonadetes bacterium]|nr:hypothetical protein [Gemmatimonadota bacterium]